MQNLEHPWRNIRGDKLLLTIDDLHRLNLELVLAVLREGPNEGIEAYVGLGSVEGSDLDEDVFGVYRYFRVLSVDDGGNRTNYFVGI